MQPAPLFFACLYTYAYVLWRKSRSSIWSNSNNMQNQRFDHALVLKMTSKMRDDIDSALILTQDTLIRTRSEFIRAACQCFLDSLAKDWGGGPVSVDERKARVLSGGNELDAEGPDQVSAGPRQPPRGATLGDTIETFE